jgi:caffeoyl-CoA O-methyltransferase
MTSTVADTVAPPRPVTPVGIVAERLERAERDLVAAGVADDLLVDLRHALRVASGLEGYVEQHTSPESDPLARLAGLTAATDWLAGNGDGGPALEQEMLSGHVEGAFLAFLVRATGARRVLEIGMFTGYAALAMAEALPAGDASAGTGAGGAAEVVALELDPRAVAVAREGFAASPAGARIRVEEGPADASLRRLVAAGERFDLVFVDADKGGYAGYLDLLVAGDLLAPGAVVAVDNTLLQGEPWSDAPSPNGAAIAAFNDRLAADAGWHRVLVPLRDGVTLLTRLDGAATR